MITIDELERICKIVRLPVGIEKDQDIRYFAWEVKCAREG